MSRPTAPSTPSRSDARAFLASQVDPLAANFPHERCPVFVSLSPVRHRVDNHPRVVNYVRDDGNNAIDFLPPVAKVFEEHRNVVIRVAARVATGSRAKQHDTLKAAAIQLGERGAE